jgi:hypothetical protein
MKKPIALILFGLISISYAEDKPAPATVAQTERPAPPAMPKQEPSFVSPVGSIEARLKQLNETVNLTAEQQTKIKAVLVKNDAAMKTAVAAFRASHTKEDRQKLSALMKAQNGEINALLSDEQKTKGQTAQNVIPSAQGFRPGSPGSGAAALTPGRGAATSIPPISSPPPAATK